MIDFSVIATHLQVRIAEKINFFDLIEFDLSSKYAGKILKFTKRKAAIKVEKIKQNNKGTFLTIKELEDRYGKKTKVEWNKLRALSELPRFKIIELMIFDSCSPTIFQEMSERAGFVSSKIKFSWRDENPIPIPIFCEFADIFYINRFFGNCGDPGILYIPQFQEMEVVSVGMDSIPIDALLQLSKLKRIGLFSGATRSTVNFLLEHWFRKTKEFDALMVTSLDLRNPSFALDSLFERLSVSIIGKCAEEHEINAFWMGTQEERKEEKLKMYENEVVCTVDRGDRTFVMLVSVRSRFVVGRHFSDLEELSCLTLLQNLQPYP